MAKNKGTFGIVSSLVGVPFLMVLGNSILIPLLPQMQSDLGISKVQANLFITLFSVPAGITIPIVGFISDRFGRKIVIIPALIIYAIGGLVSGIAPLFMSEPFTIMLAGRVIQGIGAAGTAPVAMTLVGDLFSSTQRSKVLGILEASNGFGKVMSPILGSLIGLFMTWYFVFYIYPVIAIPVVLLLAFIVKESKSAKNQQSIKNYISGIGDTFKNKGFSLAVCFLAGMVALFILFGVLSYISDVLEVRHGIVNLTKGFILAIPVFIMTIASILSGMLLKKKNLIYKIFIIVGMTILTISMAIGAFFENFIILIVLISLMGLGVGMTMTSLNTMVTSSTKIAKRGAVTCFYGSVRFFGVAFGPPVFSMLDKRGSMILFLVPASIALITAILSIIFVDQNKMLEFQKDK